MKLQITSDFLNNKLRPLHPLCKMAFITRMISLVSKIAILQLTINK